MSIDILEAYTQKQPVSRKRINHILELPREQLEKCLQDPDAQEWFVGEAFKHRYDSDDSLIKLIVNHPNCPTTMLALVETYEPNWLTESPAMAQVQLSLLEPKQRDTWNRTINTFKYKEYNYVVNILYSEDYAFLKVTLDNTKEDQLKYIGNTTPKVDRELFRRLPKFLLRHFMQEDFSETNKKRRKDILNSNQDWIAFLCDCQFIDQHLSDFTPRMKKKLLERDDLGDAYVAQLASDKSAVVRRSIAENPKTPAPVLQKLAGDENSKVAEAALKNLPEDLHNTIQSGDSHEEPMIAVDDLTAVRLPSTHLTKLQQIAASAEPLLACAATLHPKADFTVAEAAAARSDLPLWAKIGIALESSDTAILSALLDSGDSDILLALSDNPHLSKELALQLIHANQDDRLLANLASSFIDDTEILQTIIRCKPKTKWVFHLKILLDDTVQSQDLRSIYNSREQKFLVLMRLLARHPHCPKSRYPLFAFYLPEDLKKNPRYAMQVIESGKAAKPQAFDSWKVDDYLDGGHAHEFFYQWVINNDIDIGNQRKVISAKSVNPNSVRHLAILDDAPTHKRFVHSEAPAYSEYEHRVIVKIATPATQKLLIEKNQLSDVLLLELTQSTHKVVAMAAQQLAAQRNLGVSVSINKAGLKDLGNKAAREVLARESTDLEVLQLMVNDKVKSIRSAVAWRKELDYSSLLTLLKDPEPSVVVQAVQNMSHRSPQEIAAPETQEVLRTIVTHSEFDHYLRKRAFNLIQDQAFKDSLFEYGSGALDTTIIETTANPDILEKVWFDMERGAKTFNKLSLLRNPNLRAQIKREILKESQNLSRYAFEGIESIDHLLKAYADFPTELLGYMRSSHFNPRYLKLDSQAMDRLYTEMDVESFSWAARRYLPTWSEDKLIGLIDKIQGKAYFGDIFGYLELPQRVKEHLLAIVLHSNSHEVIKSFAGSISLPPDLISNLLDSDDEDLCLALCQTQKLEAQHINALAKSAHLQVREALFDCDSVDRSLIPSSLLRAFAADKDSYYSSRAQQELKRRGEDDLFEPVSASIALKQFDSPLSVVKFNQLMLERKLMTIHKRESTSTPGTFRESKLLTPAGEEYGINSLNEYGDYSIHYYPNKFSDLLKLLA